MNVHPADLIRRDKAPRIPLHGVDFSGARELGGRRNKKIWIASWHPDRESAELRSGGDDPGFGRAGLAKMIVSEPGIWVIDFPFGPPAAVAEAMKWKAWRDYLCWATPDATVLWDTLKAKVDQWSAKRCIDRARGAPMSPFNIRLFRQTILGASEVLRGVERAGRDKTRILPFHDAPKEMRELSVVIEGFPGFTLRERCLPSTGYKRSRDRPKGDEKVRKCIVESLRKGGLPICDSDRSRAIENPEGDAVDALVLLDAARSASHRNADDWRSRVGPNGCLEGWFFD